MQFTTEVAVDLKSLPPLVRLRYGDESGVKTTVLCAKHAQAQVFQELRGPQLVSLNERLTPHQGRTSTGRLYFRYQPVLKIEETGEREACQICAVQK